MTNNQMLPILLAVTYEFIASPAHFRCFVPTEPIHPAPFMPVTFAPVAGSKQFCFGNNTIFTYV